MKINKWIVRSILIYYVIISCLVSVEAYDTDEFADINNGLSEDTSLEDSTESFIFTDSAVESINELIESQNFNSSVWVKDLDTGEEYLYNSEQLYYSASIIKAPYSLWLCKQDDEGSIDISGTIANNKELCQDSKWICQYSENSDINTWACIDAMIYASDNKSTAILSRTWPANYGDAFNDFLHSTLNWDERSKGQVDNDVTNGYLTVEDSAKLLEYLYEYFQETASNGHRLKESFTQAVHKHLWFPDDTVVAKKYGSWKNAFHDIAIVYAEHPYMIACMTDAGEIGYYRSDAKKYMDDLGKLVFDITQNEDGHKEALNRQKREFIYSILDIIKYQIDFWNI